METTQFLHTEPVLVVDDDPAIRKIIRDRFVARGHTVHVAADGEEALRQVQAHAPDVMVLDLRMPNMDGFEVLEALQDNADGPDVIVITAHGSIEAAVRAVQMGAMDFVTKPFEPAHLEHVVHNTLKSRRMRRRLQTLELELSERHSLVGAESRAMQTAVHMAQRAAPSNATVLLAGESGSGKEVIARFVHANSSRPQGPFVALNCATLSAELLTSELFGHERGAFTGAVRSKPGRIEDADGGTLFLDEVGELPADLQAKLLRVLQEREFERVGGTQTIRADVRIVAATHRDLRLAISAGTFREDLYYRLNVVNIRVPPLRERPEDVKALLDHFLKRHARDAGRARLRFSDAARTKLEGYDWPGNVRELSNVVERAVVLAVGDWIGLEDLPEELRDVSPAPRTTSEAPSPTAARPELDLSGGFHAAVTEAKRQIIRQALAQTDNHQTRAAELLGLSQPYLARLMKNLGMKGAGTRRS